MQGAVEILHVFFRRRHAAEHRVHVHFTEVRRMFLDGHAIAELGRDRGGGEPLGKRGVDIAVHERLEIRGVGVARDEKPSVGRIAHKRVHLGQ